MLTVPAKPMLLSTSKKRFLDSGFIFEWKVDGVRCVAHINQDQVRLFSRHGKDCTAAFPELEKIGHNVTANSAVLDGELCVILDGKPDFDAIMSRYLTRDPKGTLATMRQKPAAYVVWDILEQDGRDLTGYPLIERKELLRQAIIPGHSLQIIDYVDGDGEALFEAIRIHELEGIVAKKRLSPYRTGKRSAEWIKIKNWQFQECFITGYRTDEPGIYLATENGKPLGFAEFGMMPVEKSALIVATKEIQVKKDKNVVWIKPLLRCQVKYAGTTSTGKLRNLCFVKFLA